MDNIKYGKILGLNIVPYFIQPIVESMLHNPHALLLLIRLRNDNYFNYYHGIDACVMALSLGRFMGLPLEEVIKLATGAPLMDIGKVNVSENIINQTGTLSDKEFGAVYSYVEHGVKFLKQDEAIHKDIINIILAQCLKVLKAKNRERPT